MLKKVLIVIAVLGFIGVATGVYLASQGIDIHLRL